VPVIMNDYQVQTVDDWNNIWHKPGFIFLCSKASI